MYESDVKGRENGYGLWNTILKSSDNGLIILFNDEIVSWGSEKLVERYISFYKRWKELNSPEIGDYIVEFYPENNLSIEDDKVFQIKRKYGTTLLSWFNLLRKVILTATIKRAIERKYNKKFP